MARGMTLPVTVETPTYRWLVSCLPQSGSILLGHLGTLMTDNPLIHGAHTGLTEIEGKSEPRDDFSASKGEKCVYTVQTFLQK
jgi:hypothetical protein